MEDIRSALAELMEVDLTARYPRVVTPAAPSAGADWSLTVPGGVRWRVRSIVAKLTTAVAVANRVPALLLSDGTSVFMASAATYNQAASKTLNYAWYPDAQSPPAATAGAWLGLPFPDVWLETGYVIASSTANMQAADQWSAIALAVEEMRTGPPAPQTVHRGVALQRG